LLEAASAWIYADRCRLATIRADNFSGCLGGSVAQRELFVKLVVVSHFYIVAIVATNPS
jgi:hypothetical protein